MGPSQLMGASPCEPSMQSGEQPSLLLLVKDQIFFFFPFAVFITPTLLSHPASLPEPSALAN